MVQRIGYQAQVDWLGEKVLSLAEVWPEGRPRAVIVGLGQSPLSVRNGHRYQGGQAVNMRRLARAGLFAEPDGAIWEPVALDAGVGFTDLVRRPIGAVFMADLRHGAPLLRESLAEHEPELVVSMSKEPVVALFGEEYPPGVLPVRTAWGGQVFRMPLVNLPAGRMAQVMQELTMLLRAGGRELLPHPEA
jgi:TDG/mug DNA glycosylase family protein